MSDLKKAGLLASHQGQAKPTLTKRPDQINIFEIYQAVNANQHLLHVDPETNPRCLVGANIQHALEDTYAQIEESAQTCMLKITLQDVIDKILLENAKKKSS